MAKLIKISAFISSDLHMRSGKQSRTLQFSFNPTTFSSDKNTGISG